MCNRNVTSITSINFYKHNVPLYYILCYEKFLFSEAYTYINWTFHIVTICPSSLLLIIKTLELLRRHHRHLLHHIHLLLLFLLSAFFNPSTTSSTSFLDSECIFKLLRGNPVVRVISFACFVRLIHFVTCGLEISTKILSYVFLY